MSLPLTRRTVLVSAAASLAAVRTAADRPATAGEPADRTAANEPFRYCFNTATIMGQKLPLDREAQIAAEAGYHGFEPWVRNIEEYAKGGGSLADLKKRIADLGLSVEDAIGFADWINDDDSARARGMEQMKRDMDLVSQIGGKRIAAPPVGAYNAAMALPKVAERYRALLELGRRMGVVPQLELWGGSQTLRRMGEVAYAITEAAHPDACPLLDVFHVYRGGSDFGGLRMFNGAAMHILHVNDYPADPPREKITDAQRVYPGDGVAPLARIFGDLRAIGFRGMLSLELFNQDLWKQDPLAVARTGLEKIKSIVAKSAVADLTPDRRRT
jgi:2-keto-myo-inositol isomerase